MPAPLPALAFAEAAGLRRGRIQGSLAGVFSAICVGGLIWMLVADEEGKSNHEDEGRTILHTMENAQAPSVSDADSDLSAGKIIDDSSEKLKSITDE